MSLATRVAGRPVHAWKDKLLAAILIIVGLLAAVGGTQYLMGTASEPPAKEHRVPQVLACEPPSICQ